MTNSSLWLCELEPGESPSKGYMAIPTSWMPVEFKTHLETEKMVREDTHFEDQAATLTPSLRLQSSVPFYSSLKAQGGGCCHLEISRDIGFHSSAANTKGLMAGEAEDFTGLGRQLPEGHVLLGTRCPLV